MSMEQLDREFDQMIKNMQSATACLEQANAEADAITGRKFNSLRDKVHAGIKAWEILKEAEDKAFDLLK